MSSKKNQSQEPSSTTPPSAATDTKSASDASQETGKPRSQEAQAESTPVEQANERIILEVRDFVSVACHRAELVPAASLVGSLNSIESHWMNLANAASNQFAHLRDFVGAHYTDKVIEPGEEVDGIETLVGELQDQVKTSGNTIAELKEAVQDHEDNQKPIIVQLASMVARAKAAGVEGIPVRQEWKDNRGVVSSYEVDDLKRVVRLKYGPDEHVLNVLESNIGRAETALNDNWRDQVNVMQSDRNIYEVLLQLKTLNDVKESGTVDLTNVADTRAHLVKTILRKRDDIIAEIEGHLPDEVEETDEAAELTELTAEEKITEESRRWRDEQQTQKVESLVEKVKELDLEPLATKLAALVDVERELIGRIKTMRSDLGKLKELKTEVEFALEGV